MDIFATLLLKQQTDVTVPVGTVTFEAKIQLSAKSSPLTGLAKLISDTPTKNGNFRYVLTTAYGHFRFFSKEKLPSTQIIDHEFGIQSLKDDKTGEVKTLYWY